MIGTRNEITNISPEAGFFIGPEKPLHRQYEALRAYFVEQVSSAEVASRFGYTPGSFRVLCHRFRNDEDLQERFFKDVQRGPQAAHVRDRLRERVVAMRKKNLSVYDIQSELRAAGEDVGIMTRLLGEFYIDRAKARKKSRLISTVKVFHSHTPGTAGVQEPPRHLPKIREGAPGRSLT